jgi:superfamily II DNA/RNA helicase
LTFSDLNIDQDMVDALAAKGIIDPFPIQSQTIPLALDGQDIIGQAKTGTGKTFGFGLPLIQSLGLEPGAGVQALVVVPTSDSCRMSRSSSPRPPRRGTPCSSRRRCPARSSRWRAGS